MKKLFVIPLMIVLVVGLVFSGCVAPTPSFEWPKSLVILGPAVEQARYIQTISWAPIMEEKTGMKIRVLVEEATPTKSGWLQEGKYPMSVEGVTSVAQTIEGVSGFSAKGKGPFQTRVIWHTQAASLGYMVQADSNIKTVYDVKPSMKVISTPSLPATEQSIDAFLAWAKLTREDMVTVPFGDWPSSAKSLIEGKVDIAYGSATAAYTVEIAAGPHGVRFLEMDPEEDPDGFKRYNAVKPTVAFGPCTRGVSEAVGVTMGLFPSVLHSAPDIDPELVYQFVKWLDENLDLYKDKHVTNPQMSREAMRAFLNMTYLPIHEGTIRYLKEIGLWTAADDARQEYNVDLFTQYVEAFKEAVMSAEGLGITVDPMNEKWTEFWTEFKKQRGIPPVQIRL